MATKPVTAKLRLRLELIAALPEPIMLDRLRRLSSRIGTGQECMRLPVAISYTRIVSSRSATASSAPSGEKALSR